MVTLNEKIFSLVWLEESEEEDFYYASVRKYFNFYLIEIDGIPKAIMYPSDITDEEKCKLINVAKRFKATIEEA